MSASRLLPVPSKKNPTFSVSLQVWAADRSVRRQCKAFAWSAKLGPPKGAGEAKATGASKVSLADALASKAVKFSFKDGPAWLVRSAPACLELIICAIRVGVLDTRSLESLCAI